LRTILPKDYQPEGYELPPSQAAAIPSLLTIASRWPGMPQEQMEALHRDYQSEGLQLEQLSLEDEYQKVKELAQQDIVW
jgi:nuclear pore complex protein Nup133